MTILPITYVLLCPVKELIAINLFTPFRKKYYFKVSICNKLKLFSQLYGHEQTRRGHEIEILFL